MADSGLTAQNHSIEAEQALIGAVLINNDAYGLVQSILQPEHFAEPVHREIYEIIGKLVGIGKIATPVTIKPYVAAGFDLGGVTVGQYIARLAANATTVINAPDYARTVRDLADGRMIVEIGKTLAETVTPDVVDLAAYGVDMLDALVADRSMNSAPARMLDQSLMIALDKTATAYQNEGRLTGVPTGLRDLDAKTLGGHAGHLIVLGGRPGMGKTALAVSIVRNMAKLKRKGIFFSLEMPDDELSMRMIADEMYDHGKLQYWQIKSGKYHERYFERIQAAIERLKDLPLKIEQQPFLTIAQIAARSRQFKRRFGLEYLIIDHLGLIKPSGRYAGNKVNETGETTGALKALAKELGIPIYLLAQLNRGLEQREDKRPTLSDLRHCLVGDTRVVDAGTGRWKQISDVRKGDKLLGVGVDQKIRIFDVADQWQTGMQPVFRMTTQTGKQITGTASHRFLTERGWVKLGDLLPGQVIAAAMRLPEHGTKNDDADRCRLLGYMVGDGTYLKHRAVGFISSDAETFADVLAVVSTEFPLVKPRMKAGQNRKDKAPIWVCDFVQIYENGYGRPGGNALREWFRDIGVFGQKHFSKRIPGLVFETEKNAANFLAGYLSADGCVKVRKRAPAVSLWEIHFDTVSRGLAADVQALLLRLGIVSTVNDGYTSKVATQPIYRVSVSSAAHNLRRFAETMPARGKKGRLLSRLLTELSPETYTGPGIFALPRCVSEIVAEAAPWVPSSTGRTLDGWRDQKKRMRRDVCRSWGRRLGRDDLTMWADSDLLWEEIRRIEPAGVREVFDISLPGCENFIANGIVAHNSGDIEQDADTVILLHRPAYYLEQKEPKAGSAEFLVWSNDIAQVHDRLDAIIAKQRSGPLGTVRLFCDIGCNAIRDAHGEMDGSADVGEMAG